MRLNTKRAILSSVLFAIFGIIIIILQPSSITRYNPSGYPAYVPELTDSFEFYVEENRRRIRAALTEYDFSENSAPFGPQYSLEKVVDMRSPYQILPSDDNCDETETSSRKGFLLVHGLSDSPYLLHNVAESISAIYPCALLRALLNAGHGTIPGDLANVRLEQWITTFEYGLSNLANETDELYVVGYSNGSALALNHLITHPDENIIDALILLSPGLKTADERSMWTPYLRYIYKWIVQKSDRDAVKYESFATNAAAEFFELTQAVIEPDFSTLTTPTLMVVSSEDTTIDYKASVDFFCNKLTTQNSSLILLVSHNNSEPLHRGCDGVQTRVTEFVNDRVVSYSHVGMTIPPDDMHYGIDGNNPVCVSHEGFPDRFERCLNDDLTSVYAENNFMDENGLFQGNIVRRTSFNPTYAEMISDIHCFIEKSCN